MRYIADLHIHSLYSRATSKASNIASLAAWSRVKGVHLLGTGDFTHPAWLRQLKETLCPAEPGFFRLRDEISPQLTAPLVDSITPEPIDSRFLLTAEISSIYKRGDKVRKVHNLIFVPDFESAERISAKLATIGNIESDGRPILGLDSRDLLEIVLELAPQGFLVPAHIWTPWFSLFGSKSGFDSIEECFGDLSSHIFCLETGLSSDPEMNRLISALDRFSLISNSDCHSPAKLCREANIFTTGFDYFSLREALKSPCDEQGNQRFTATIEFYPEEGKYHHDGHRKCDFCCDPYRTRELDGKCPVCAKPMTVGVHSRVIDLADRTEPLYPKGSPGVHSLIPLQEVLGELLGVGPQTKTVAKHYLRLINTFGSELNVLLLAPEEELKNKYSSLLAEAIRRVRSGEVHRKPGFDGNFGEITVFAGDERSYFSGQQDIFGNPKKRKRSVKRKLITESVQSFSKNDETENVENVAVGNNLPQEEAVTHNGTHLLIQAGPGSGKTYTLVKRVTRILEENWNQGSKMVLITFTNKASDEMKKRVLDTGAKGAEQVLVSTFHGFCLGYLRRLEPDLRVVGEKERHFFLKRLESGLSNREIAEKSKQFSAFFTGQSEVEPPSLFKKYLELLRDNCLVDLDEVVSRFNDLFLSDQARRTILEEEICYLFVDEFQDLNREQFQLVKSISAWAEIFGIGDANQAIYGFRGCNPEFFNLFQEEENCKSLQLDLNYRCPATILNAAESVIDKNYPAAPEGRQHLKPVKGKGDRIRYVEAVNEVQEARFIKQEVERLLGGTSHRSMDSGSADHDEMNFSFSDIAILFRSSRLLAPLAKNLEQSGIPFQTVGVEPFYAKKQFRPVYSLVRVAAGSTEIEDYLHYISSMKGIGAKRFNKVESRLPFSCSGEQFWQVAREFGKTTGNKILEQGFQLQHQLAEGCMKESVLKVMRNLDIWDIFPEENKNRFLDLCGLFGQDLTGLSNYLRENLNQTLYDERAEKVALMTLHGAKGLEFPVVFMVGVEEGILPSAMSAEENVDEERRLFYVGMTRARKRLYLSRCHQRNGVIQEKSRFIDEIPKEALMRIEQKQKKKKKLSKQLPLF